MQRKSRNGQRSFHPSNRTGIFLLLCGILCGGISSFLAGCGASVQSTLAVPTVEVHEKGKVPERITTSTFLYIDEFLDKRGTEVIANVSGKPVVGKGDVVPAVTAGLKSALEKRGFAFSDAAPIIISGEVRTWKADVNGSLPTHINAEAAIFLEVLDPANKRIYSGLYRGYAQMDQGSVDGEDVRKTLGNAMEEAVVQVSSDTQLVSLLASY